MNKSELHAKIRKEVVSYVSDLLDEHWWEVEENRDDKGKMSISFKAVIDDSKGENANVKVTSSFTKSFKDEIEGIVSGEPQLPGME